MHTPIPSKIPWVCVCRFVRTCTPAVTFNAATLRVSLQVLPRMQLTDPIHPRFGGTQVRSQLLLRPALASSSSGFHC